MNCLLVITILLKSFYLGLPATFPNIIFSTVQPQKCAGITTKGKPCQKEAIPGKLYCYYHNPKRITCDGINASGKKCLNDPVRGSNYCSTHDPARLKCKSLNSRGMPCQNSPIEGTDFCRFHVN